jgi:hypothetical protein
MLLDSSWSELHQQLQQADLVQGCESSRFCISYISAKSHICSRQRACSEHDCPLTLQTKLQDSPGLPTTTLMPNNFDTELGSVDPEEFCCTEKQ